MHDGGREGGIREGESRGRSKGKGDGGMTARLEVEGGWGSGGKNRGMAQHIMSGSGMWTEKEKEEWQVGELEVEEV